MNAVGETCWVVPGRAPAPVQPPGVAALNVLLIVSPVPYPPVWGFGQRVFQLARHLARSHHVRMVCQADARQLPDVEGMAEHVHGVTAVVGVPPAGAARRIRQLRSLLSREPFHVRGSRSIALERAVADTVARHRFDVIILESSQLGWIPLPDDVPVLIDEHNIESELLERMATSERSAVRRAFYRREFASYRRFEEATWGTAAGCATTSERDAAMLRARRPEVQVAVVPNGVDPEHFAPEPGREVPERILFTGLLDYRPNFDGIAWFRDEIVPLIRAERPGAQVQIVGVGAPQVLASLRGPGIEVTGRVPDLRIHLGEASVVVIPLRIGGGTRLKLVEAMSMGKAIVSTPLGAEGVTVEDAKDVLIASDPPSFASAVCSLLGDPELRDRLGREARALASDEYSWERSAAQLDALLRDVVARGIASPGRTGFEDHEGVARVGHRDARPGS